MYEMIISILISRSDEFEFHGHYCMVMPMLGCSLYDVLKENDYRPFPMSYIRPILQHVCCDKSEVSIYSMESIHYVILLSYYYYYYYYYYYIIL